MYAFYSNRLHYFSREAYKIRITYTIIVFYKLYFVVNKFNAYNIFYVYYELRNLNTNDIFF